uniref:Uncharacterized protein n=1 Tax=Parascaris univalens TaxID=6257 RepID=A0A914ZEL4_PARUN
TLNKRFVHFGGGLVLSFLMNNTEVAVKSCKFLFLAGEIFSVCALFCSTLAGKSAVKFLSIYWCCLCVQLSLSKLLQRHFVCLRVLVACLCYVCMGACVCVFMCVCVCLYDYLSVDVSYAHFLDFQLFAVVEGKKH